MRYNWTFCSGVGRGRAHPATGHGTGVWAGLALALVASMAVGGLAAVDSAPPRARLSTISAKVAVRGASVFIESSEPVAYATARPDPLTILVDLRHTTIAGVLNRVAASPVGPVVAVTFEDAKASDGAPVARVRLLLATPARHEVHSDRNVIQVDVVPDGGPVTGSGALALPAEPQAPTTPTTPPPAAPQAQAKPPTPPPAALQAPAKPPTSPAATAAGQMPSQVGATGRQYTGHAVSLDFYGADLRAVLRTLADISGLNLVIDPKVDGSVDVTLRDVPWDQALDHILRSNKLGYVIDGTIVRVAPLSVLSDEEKARRDLANEQALSGELKVMTKTLNYANALDFESLLKDNALSKRGTFAVDKRTNTLIINDLPSYLAKAEALINTLDQPEGQVEIEARIVLTTKTFARQLGVTWGFLGQAVPALANTTSLAFPNSVVSSGQVTQPAPNATSVARLALGAVNGAFNLNLELSALEREGRVKILQQPRVTAQNNTRAEIKVGTEIPVQVVTATGGVAMASVTFKPAALSLIVTPRITGADTVFLDVDVDNGSAGQPEVNGNRSINTQRATTKVLVANGATTVIGGIYSATEDRSDGRTPGLGRIPLLRWLFKTETVNDTNQELLIFITPKIVRLK